MKFFFVGIKGAGMAALACMMKEIGHEVEGSDLEKHFFTEEQLHDSKIKMHPFGVLPSPGSTVIIGNAFKDDFEDVIKIRQDQSLIIYRYHQFLGTLVKQYHSVAVSGSHGKTTTTSMMAAMLKQKEPTAYLIGDGHGHLAQDSYYFALEADEYRRFFIDYFPEYAIITNVDLDHVDFYKDEEDYRQAFIDFSHNVSKCILMFGDDPLVRSLKVETKHLYYGISADNDVYAEILDEQPSYTRFNLYYLKQNLGEIRLPFSGRHLVWNALATIGIALQENFTLAQIQAGLDAFKGAARRFVVEEAKGYVYIDDYAHHPTEVSVTIDAARLRYPNKKLIAIFKPHRVSRVYHFADAFAQALLKADKVYLCEFNAIDDKEVGIDINIHYLQERCAGSIIIDENEQGAKELAQNQEAVYLFMSSKDIYVLANLVKRYHKS